MALRSHTLFVLFTSIFIFASTIKANRAGGPGARLKFCDYILQIGGHNSHCPFIGMGRSVKARDEEANNGDGQTGKKLSIHNPKRYSCLLISFAFQTLLLH